ncbi:SDR family oxidoreductase [Daejeonella sp.]|uniref:SDR family oxidoreductase n=1 Tax=Daejeonella sp. TaxID=2805397 RepID=UPI00271FC38E|nr:SDR family oxidoreductase [Daejeonella sp.]MDO8992212.1 SDR family oxidoreductase [Daejeonella sp.]MDP2412532.1 SDR family oxidoreductase [Daejeonella sp.]
MEVKNKIIWITGASSGIGEALCYELNQAGAKLIISSRSTESLYQVKSKCMKNQLDVHVLPLDLENTLELEDKANAALNIFGRIDIIIHSGGVSQRSLAMDTDLDVAQKIMNINFWGTVALTKAVIPSMLSNQSGHIVIISSLVGKFGTKFRSAYSASKHALHGYFDSLRSEIDPKIKISIICPGFIKTNVTINALTADGTRQNTMDDAQANGMSADECAVQIIKAIKSGKEEVYIGGKEKYAVLLKRFLPGLFSKIVRKAKVT